MYIVYVYFIVFIECFCYKEVGNLFICLCFYIVGNNFVFLSEFCDEG